jgi:hypothetical protein
LISHHFGLLENEKGIADMANLILVLAALTFM